MGNNRMVVNQDGTIEQITHYYPYGPRSHRESIFMLSARRRGFSRGQVIGDISTNESLQKFKFEGKELDRTFGLDNYDIHARQYFAMAPMWDRPDKLSEKYYGISPYVYCGGDPVNLSDPTGAYLVGTDGNPISLSGDSWSDNCTDDILTVCNEMIKTDIGTSLVNAMIEAEYPITITLVEGFHKDKNGNSITNQVGGCDIKYKDSQTIESADITLYLSAIEDVVNCARTNIAFQEGSIEQRYQSNTKNDIDQNMVIGGAGVHEATHATNPNANKIGFPRVEDKPKREIKAIENEVIHLKSLK